LLGRLKGIRLRLSLHRLHVFLLSREYFAPFWLSLSGSPVPPFHLFYSLGSFDPRKGASLSSLQTGFWAAAVAATRILANGIGTTCGSRL